MGPWVVQLKELDLLKRDSDGLTEQSDENGNVLMNAEQNS